MCRDLLARLQAELHVNCGSSPFVGLHPSSLAVGSRRGRAPTRRSRPWVAAGLRWPWVAAGLRWKWVAAARRRPWVPVEYGTRKYPWNNGFRARLRARLDER